MSIYSVEIYRPHLKNDWNAFIASAKNSTFLFDRDFMGYHEERFEDASLMVYNKEKIMAVLPANRVGDKVFSHQGLTYGGLVLAKKIKLKETLLIFAALLWFLKKEGIKELTIKSLPSFYTLLPSEELDYPFFLLNAKTIRVDVASVIDYGIRLPIQKNRLEGIRKAEKQGLKIEETQEFAFFWNKILIPNLAKKHNAKPVHPLDEIELLAQRFPKSIRQFNVLDAKGAVVAGATIFETEQVAHVQYISSNGQRQELGSLDFLFHHLIERVFAHKKYFDFGTSNEEEGKKLNTGLNYWKESFGARSFVYRTHSIATKDHIFLKSTLI